MEETIYKILTRGEWSAAEAEGIYTGSRVDVEDGFIHFSTAAQVRETAAKHFADRADLVLLSVDFARCPGQALRWEPSRGGQLFPHLYGALDPGWVARVDPLPLEAGGHRFPHDLPGEIRMRRPTVGANSVDAFRRDGVAHLPGVFADWVERLRAGVEENIAAPGPWSKTRRANDADAPFFVDYCNWQRIDAYRAFLLESSAAAMAANVMDSTCARLFHEHVLVKEPGASMATPWHHDQPYYCVDGEQTCSLWVALDDVPADRGVEFLAGSHRWGRWFRPKLFDNEPLTDGAGWEEMPDIDAERDHHRILSFDVASGDALAFSFLTVHGAPPNRSRERRRGFACRWLGDDCRYADRAGPTSPPFPDLGLREGDPFDLPLFPLVHPGGDRGADL